MSNTLLALAKDLSFEFHSNFFNQNQHSLALSPSTSGTLNWGKRRLGWVKLNTDASVYGENNNAAIGGVARESQGDWIWRIPESIGNTDADLAELQAYLKG